jgi:neprilysin
MQLKIIISEPIKDDEIEPFKNVKRLYRACMDTEMIETRGTYPLKKVLNSIGGWPMVDEQSWNSNKSWTWQHAMKKVAENGHSVHYMFLFGVSFDDKNTSKRVLVVS